MTKKKENDLDNSYMTFYDTAGKQLKFNFSDIAFVAEVGQGRTLIVFRAGQIVQSRTRFKDLLEDIVEHQEDYKHFKMLKITAGFGIIGPNDEAFLGADYNKEKGPTDELH